MADKAEAQAVAAKVAELASDGPADGEEVHGVYLGAKLIVQCAECGEVLPEIALTNSDPAPERTDLDDHFVVCPTCSKAAGHEVRIPIFVLVGEATMIIPDHPDDEAAPEPAPEAPAAAAESPPAAAVAETREP